MKQAVADYKKARAKKDTAYNRNREKLAVKNKGGAFFPVAEL